jgi:hypothetical protein
MFKTLVGWKRYLAIGVAILALVAAIVFGVRGCQEDERQENNQLINTGELIERGAASEEVIKDVEEARNAVDNPTDADRRNVCEKYDRNCKNSQ